MSVNNENLTIQTDIVCEMEDEWLVNRQLETADSYPIALNNKLLDEDFRVDNSFFAGYSKNYEINYTFFVTVDEKGEVTNIRRLVLDNARILKKVEECIGQIKFKPALKNGQPVVSYTVVIFLFKLVPK